ncbi:MAG: preprotein translocase subunit SecA [Fimbriimonadaceae bacterium]|jgi:preprotein translocase subunit SecA|nr:preprotein translocase subunit SecA [Fimbriimonadaceae bacterium]
MQFLRNIFDTSKRDVEAVMPVVAKISELEESIARLSDEELKAKTAEFKQQLASGKTLEEIMPEAFAAAREASNRTLGMRQFDVQMVGSAVLHQGRIAEMKTGEGKTLVAVAPMYLNALTGKGVHLVTVNDYLARRDAVWMGPIYHFLGMSVGVIQGQAADSDELGGSYIYQPGCDEVGDPRYLNLRQCSRREAYGADITYGTNHEFGFDYLRDNMAFHEEELVMRELNFAIVDEVDSILIDEARTPHIISGASTEDVTVYKQINGVITQVITDEANFTVDKKNHQASLSEEGMDRVEEILGIDNIAADPRMFHYVNAALKAHTLFDKNVEYVVRGGEVVIVDENTGRLMFGRRFSDGLHQALEAKENVEVQRESQTIATITFQNLFRLYHKLAGMTGTAKTEEDEFRKIYGLDVVSVPTHRPMVRADHEDVIFKTLEAKYRAIGWEILKLYSKQQPVLVGTRSIEMSEQVSARLTPDMLQKLIVAKRLQQKIENSKDVPKELKDDVKAIYETGLGDWDRQMVSTVLSKMGMSGDVLKGDWMDWALEHWGLTAKNREYLEEAIKHGIPHNVLNAKYHEREALIIAEAGRKGAVTIATNMAGRGVDILLGGRVEDELVRMARDLTDEGDEEGQDEYSETYASHRRGGQERAAPPLPLSDTERRKAAEEVRELGGLFILGTERHESRRIDNQLRGRAGRQGDPGESRFYVALEDMLWKIFNPKMMENPALKIWPPMEEVNAKFLSGMIQKTQQRIEQHFFEARKHVLEYDDVLNAQREHTYGWRREIMLGKDIREELQGQVRSLIEDVVANAWMVDDEGKQEYDYQVLYEDLADVFPIIDYSSVTELEQHAPGPALIDFVQSKAIEAYQKKIDEFGDELMRRVERDVMLQAVNDHWMHHLQIVEYIREGIGLRGYGQVDPLIAFKRETFDAFQQTLKDIRDQAVKTIFHATLKVQAEPAQPEPQMIRMENSPAELVGVTSGTYGGGASYGKESHAKHPDMKSIDWTRVGRNDPCPCGSGKKFKSCHYAELREQKVI